MENQTLWNQIYQLKEKENILKNVIANFMKQNGLSLNVLPPSLQNEFDFSILNLKDQKENSPTFIAQTTTKTHFPSGNLPFSQNYQGPQHEMPKDLRLNTYQSVPQSFEKEFTYGGGRYDQGSGGENKVPSYGFESNLSSRDPWSTAFGNPKSFSSGNERLSKATFGDENITPNFTSHGKRKFSNHGDKDETDMGTKKIKTSNVFGNGDSKTSVKEEGTLVVAGENFYR